MDFTAIPDDASDGEEAPPAFDELASPESLFRDGPIRERLLDVVVGLRTPTKVSTIADHAECDTETAREYLQWFTELGLVSREDGRPVRYERNDAYFEWRRINRLREEYSEQELVQALADVLDRIDDYRAQFDAEHPDDVSLVSVTREQELSTEQAWEALSEWATLEQRAALLDAARRDGPIAGSTPRNIDA